MRNQQDLYKNRRIIYTAQSKHFYYAKMFVCKYTLEQNVVLLNIWSYFMNDIVDRDNVRCENNNIIRSIGCSLGF